MIKGSAVEVAETMKSKIDRNYCLRTGHIFELHNHYKGDSFRIAVAAFNLGYAEGTKAEKARIKKSRKAVRHE